MQRRRLITKLFPALIALLPAMSPVYAWDAGSLGCKHGKCENLSPNTRHDGERRSTHLWIVNRALDMLLKSNDPVAVRVAQKINTDACRLAMEEGLWKADEMPLADTQGGQKGSHFFNPTRKDWNGNPYNYLTYQVAGADQISYGSARENTIRRLANAGNLTTPGRCEELGMALHYFTDLTQPMHTSGFMGLSVPISLHPAFEEYIGSIQGQVSQSDSWQRLWPGKTPGEVLVETATLFNSKAPALMRYLANSAQQYGICNLFWSGVSNPMPPPYHGVCFSHPGRAIENVREFGNLMREGAQATASFLYAALAEGANAQVAVAPNSAPLSRNEGFTLKGPDGKFLSKGTVSQKYWYATFGGGAQIHGFDSSGPLLSGQTVKLITRDPDPSFRQYNKLMAPKTGNNCYYSYDTDNYENWVIWKANIGMHQGQRINDGDKIVLENKAYPGRVLRADGSWLGVGTFYPWTIDKR